MPPSRTNPTLWLKTSTRLWLGGSHGSATASVSTEEIKASAAPTRADVASLAPTTRPRFGDMRNVDVAVLWRNSPAMIKMPITRTERAPDDDADMTLRIPSVVLNAGPPPDFPAGTIALIALIGTKASAGSARP